MNHYHRNDHAILRGVFLGPPRRQRRRVLPWLLCAALVGGMLYYVCTIVWVPM